MNKWARRRQPNSLPERLNVKSLYCLCGRQPTDISSFNNGPVQTIKHKKQKEDKHSRIYFKNIKPNQKKIITYIYIYIYIYMYIYIYISSSIRLSSNRTFFPYILIFYYITQIDFNLPYVCS